MRPSTWGRLSPRLDFDDIGSPNHIHNAEDTSVIAARYDTTLLTFPEALAAQLVKYLTGNPSSLGNTSPLTPGIEANRCAEGDPVSGPVAMRLGVGGSWSTVERIQRG